MLMLEKSLPPLPHELNLRPQVEQPDARPRTVYTYDPRQMPPGASPPIEDLAAPRPPFRNADTRRQSFGGMTSRPNVIAQTIPAPGVYGQDFKPPSGRYDEFGASRRSLGYFQEKKQPNLTTPSKRKSRFGLATLLGRKSQMLDNELMAGGVSQDFPSPRRSTSDPRDEAVSNSGYAHSGSRHSVGPRMSVMSRKAIDELVCQDQDFVAYRYPSNDQRLDLLR